MVADPFAGCWERLKRADSHREAAVTEWNSFLERAPYEFRFNVDNDGHGTMWIDQVEPVPPILSVLFGEYFYNLRTALDYCVYAVAVCDSEKSPPPGEGALQFPIYPDEVSFVRNNYRIKALSDEHKLWLEDVQPYHGQDGPKTTTLYWINHLARLDRHRQLHVVGAYIAESTPMVYLSRPGAVFFEDVNAQVLVEGDTEIARFLVDPFTPGDKIEANPYTALGIEIAEMARGRPEEATWLFAPIARRFTIFVEPFIDAIIGRFEKDCLGSTRSKYLRQDFEIDGSAE
jgi:hypothetical protein